jgi:TolB protein
VLLRARGFVPVWIPHSNRIAYETNDGGDYDLLSVELNGRHPVQLLHGIGRAAWSRDGRRMVVDRPDSRIPRSQIWVADSSGRHGRVVVRNTSMDGAQAVWSPDGRDIAFVGGSNTGAYFIDVVRDNGRDRVRLTHGGKEQFPAWSPNGKQIAFTVQGSSSHIGIVNANGTAVRIPTRGGWEDSIPTWSPDGRWIAFGSTRTGN